MRARLLIAAVLLVAGLDVGVGPGVAAAASPGPWVWPLAGPHLVSDPFDPPATRYGAGHRGADLPGTVGQPVRAAGAGRISYAGLLAGRGVVVVVHGELRTTYEPVTSVVRVGAAVAAGETIGRLDSGHAGCTSTCLHWGLLRGRVYLDPVRLVRRGPSRLLPLSGVLPEVTPAGPQLAPDVPQLAPAVPQLAPAAPQLADRVPVPTSPLPPPPPGRPHRALPPSPHTLRPVDRPKFALRAAQAPWAAGALLALLAGLALLRRPPPRVPEGPATAGHVASVAVPPMIGGTAPVLVDLNVERSRRRHAQ